jgi:hypothetical protein
MTYRYFEYGSTRPTERGSEDESTNDYQERESAKKQKKADAKLKKAMAAIDAPRKRKKPSKDKEEDSAEEKSKDSDESEEAEDWHPPTRKRRGLEVGEESGKILYPSRPTKKAKKE